MRKGELKDALTLSSSTGIKPIVMALSGLIFAALILLMVIGTVSPVAKA